MPGELEQQFRAIVAREKNDFEKIMRDGGLGLPAGRVYLSYLYLRSAGKILGTPSHRRNLKKIRSCVLQNWNELGEAILTELGVDVRVPAAR